MVVFALQGRTPRQRVIILQLLVAKTNNQANDIEEGGEAGGSWDGVIFWEKRMFFHSLANLPPVVPI